MQWFSNEAECKNEGLSNFQLIEAIRLKFGTDGKALKALANWLEDFRIKNDRTDAKKNGMD